MAAIKTVPSLIIGIGGTGVMVATYVKKDLLEMTGTNELPGGVQILAFDTLSKNPVRVGGYGRPRQAGGPQTGAVELDAGQYVYIGGQVLDDAKEVAAGQHPYLASWWNAKEYLADNLPQQLWNLTDGAGQYRQFGRMALFKNLTTVQAMIDSALQSIRNSLPGTTKLYVHIAGSFVGGTGAGLFADLAHIISIFARKQGMSQISIRGYFALVDAFLGTPQVGLADPRKKSTYQAQAYAALRECSRLLSAADWATGYPMHYADYGDPEFLLGKMDKSPYDAVYLFDGHRNANPLTQHRIEEGIAPTIADAIVAHVDEKSGSTFTQHTVNSTKQRPALRIPAEVATYGTLGTFTIVLPIFHIVEEWTHRLAQEVLDELLVPLERDRDTGIPNVLAPNKRGGTAAEPGSHGADKGREWLKKNAPTGLIRDLGEIGEKHSRPATQNEVVNDLKSRSVETWIKLLKPEDMSALTSDAIERATLVLESDLTREKVKRGGVTELNEYYVHPNPGGSDRDQADQIAAETRKMFRVLVGEVNEETGRREGGRVKAMLDDLKAIHITKFRTALRTTLEEVLNGSAGADAFEAKAGKLGYMLAYLKQIRDDLREARSAIEKTEGGRRDSGAARRAQGGERESIEGQLKEADEKMRRGGGLLGANRKAYLTIAQNYLQLLKKEIAERVTWETVDALIKVADDAYTEAMNWAEALAMRNAQEGGLYALVLEGRSNNAHDRERSEQARVRHQINDPEYENNKYQDYVSRGGTVGERTQLQKILKDFVWEVHIDTNTGRLRLGLELKQANLGTTKARHVGDANARLLLDYCRSVFDGAWEDLSVIKYLMDKYGPQQEKTINDLAQMIYQKTGPLLRVRGEPPLPANYVRACLEGATQAGTTEQKFNESQTRFLSQLSNDLATLNKVQVTRPSGEEGAQAKFVDWAPSTDRFKLSFVYFSELNQLQDIAAYTEATTAYRTYPGRRTYLHIFPAEQHAVHYEEQLGKMNPPQRPREFADRVVVQLEDLERFKFIVRCLVYGNSNWEWSQSEVGGQGEGLLLYRCVPPPAENPNNLQVYRLTAEPRGEKHGDILIDPLSGRAATARHWNLTEFSYPASLLEAFNQFNYLKHAKNNDQDTIDDERVRATLEKAIEWDRARRAADPRGFPWRAPAGWTADKVRDAERRVAQYLRYQEVRNTLQAELQKDYRAEITPGQTPQATDPSRQREADLRTVIVLFLEEEIRSLKDQIDRDGGTWVYVPDTSRTVAAPQPSPAEVSPGGAAPTTVPAPPSPEPSPAASDLMAQLERLAKLKEQGVLTEEEFKAAKAKLLGL